MVVHKNYFVVSVQYQLLNAAYWECNLDNNKKTQNNGMKKHSLATKKRGNVTPPPDRLRFSPFCTASGNHYTTHYPICQMFFCTF